MLKFLQAVGVEALGGMLVYLPEGNCNQTYKLQIQFPCQMKPWQLAKMTRVLKVRANLVLIFSLQNHYRFLVKSLNWYKITALSFFATVTINATLFSSPFPSSSSKKAQNNAAKLAYNHFSLLSPPLSPFLLLPPLW